MSAKFKDKKGRDWAVEIHTSSLARIKRETGIDLLTVHDSKSTAWAEMTGDIVKLLDVLVSLVRPQLTAEGLTPDEFGEVLLQEHLTAAVDAIMWGLLDFYPPPKRAILERCLRAVTEAAHVVESRQTQTALKTLNSMSHAELTKKVEAALTSGLSSTSSPESSA